MCFFQEWNCPGLSSTLPRQIFQWLDDTIELFTYFIIFLLRVYHSLLLGASLDSAACPRLHSLTLLPGATGEKCTPNPWLCCQILKLSSQLYCQLPWFPPPATKSIIFPETGNSMEVSSYPLIPEAYFHKHLLCSFLSSQLNSLKLISLHLLGSLQKSGPIPWYLWLPFPKSLPDLQYLFWNKVKQNSSVLIFNFIYHQHIYIAWLYFNIIVLIFVWWCVTFRNSSSDAQIKLKGGKGILCSVHNISAALFW